MSVSGSRVTRYLRAWSWLIARIRAGWRLVKQVWAGVAIEAAVVKHVEGGNHFDNWTNRHRAGAGVLSAARARARQPGIRRAEVAHGATAMRCWLPRVRICSCGWTLITSSTKTRGSRLPRRYRVQHEAGAMRVIHTDLKPVNI